MKRKTKKPTHQEIVDKVIEEVKKQFLAEQIELLSEIRDLLKSNIITVLKFEPEKPIGATQVTETSNSYDWWLLQNGSYAKVYRTKLQGSIFQEDGKELQASEWNPLSMKNEDFNSGWNLVKRKEGFDPKGWPQWTK